MILFKLLLLDKPQSIIEYLTKVSIKPKYTSLGKEMLVKEEMFLRSKYLGKVV